MLSPSPYWCLHPLSIPPFNVRVGRMRSRVCMRMRKTTFTLLNRLQRADRQLMAMKISYPMRPLRCESSPQEQYERLNQLKYNHLIPRILNYVVVNPHKDRYGNRNKQTYQDNAFDTLLHLFFWLRYSNAIAWEAHQQQSCDKLLASITLQIFDECSIFSCRSPSLVICL